MIVLEKLLLLKTISLFKYTPEEILMHVATSMAKEKPMVAGEELITKGSSGTAMFVVVNGKVKVHDQEVIVTELGEREIFGELSALSLEPRSASITALTDGLLLKINSNDLYDLMSLDIGITKGIIHALCIRARSMTAQIQSIMRSD